MRLSELAKGSSAVVRAVETRSESDAIARRLKTLGFVPGEPVKLLTRGPFGEPVLVQIGATRFALRGSEAARIHLEATV